MDTQSLQVFLAVADNNSFTLAAEKLFLTQPAVSKRIAALEGQLGCALFDRIGREIHLTEAGRTLLPRARQWLLELDDIRRSISNLNGEVTGVLRIGTSHHIGLHRLPPTLRRFSQHYPQVQLDIHFIDSEEAWDAVLHGHLELGVVTLPPEPDPRVQQTPIWDDPLVFMAAPEHPLAKEAKLSLETLTRYPALLPSPSTFTRRLVAQVFQAHGLQAQIAMSTNYLETLYMMVSIGLGWSLLPQAMLDNRVKRLDVAAALPVRQLGYVTHPARSLSNAARCFIDMLTETHSEIP
jgi:DNA-binding transcriptional LysR family regulator